MYDYDDSYLHSLRSRWRNVARGNLLESHYDVDAGNGDDDDDDDDDEYIWIYRQRAPRCTFSASWDTTCGRDAIIPTVANSIHWSHNGSCPFLIFGKSWYFVSTMSASSAQSSPSSPSSPQRGATSISDGIFLAPPPLNLGSGWGWGRFGQIPILFR